MMISAMPWSKRELPGVDEGARTRADLGGGLYDALGVIEAEVEELSVGVEPVAGFGIVDLALHDVDEEADDFPAVVGLLAYDFGEGWLLVFDFGLGFCGEHMFYGNGSGRLGSTGEWRGVGWLRKGQERPQTCAAAGRHEHDGIPACKYVVDDIFLERQKAIMPKAGFQDLGNAGVAPKSLGRKRHDYGTPLYAKPNNSQPRLPHRSQQRGRTFAAQ